MDKKELFKILLISSRYGSGSTKNDAPQYGSNAETLDSIRQLIKYSCMVTDFAPYQ
jgi:hypothetical protein